MASASSCKTPTVASSSSAREEVIHCYRRVVADVIHAAYVTPDLVQVTLQKKAEYIRPNSNTHCVNGSLTTAYSRMALDRGIRSLLEDANTRVLYW